MHNIKLYNIPSKFIENFILSISGFPKIYVIKDTDGKNILCLLKIRDEKNYIGIQKSGIYLLNTAFFFYL